MDDGVVLREAVVSAVCAKEYRLLPGVIQRLAKLSPPEDVLRGSGLATLLETGTSRGLLASPPSADSQDRLVLLARRLGVACGEIDSSAAGLVGRFFAPRPAMVGIGRPSPLSRS